MKTARSFRCDHGRLDMLARVSKVLARARATFHNTGTHAIAVLIGRRRFWFFPELRFLA